jgi:hypothetical protein
MRASRDIVASRQILPRLNESSITYPLSAALHSLEDYYRAGTFTAGLIPALQESGAAAKIAADEKAVVITYGSTDTTKALSVCINKAGSVAKLVGLANPPTPIGLARIRFELYRGRGQQTHSSHKGEGGGNLSMTTTTGGK